MLAAAGWQHEEELWKSGRKFVAGLDEVGRGAWAGPVVSAAVIFPPKCNFPSFLYDSKLIPAKKREELAFKIKEKALSFSFGIVGVRQINRFGIGEAAQKSFRRSLKNLQIKPDFVLIDAFYVRYFKKQIQRPIKHGDSLCASIAAASIIAKVERDKILTEMDKHFPGYGFAVHKGYGTKAHQEALQRYSLSKEHRLSFDLSAYLTI